MDTDEQLNNSKREKGKRKKGSWLAPWQYKPGQSGNPSGRKGKGQSLKEYIQLKIARMTDDEKEEYLRGMNKDKIWEMAEGKASGGAELTIDGNVKKVKISL